MGISKMSLLYLALKKVYHKCVNACINFTKDVFWYCTCYKFQGCRKQNDQQDNCYICRVEETYCQEGFEKVKKNLLNLSSLQLLF